MIADFLTISNYPNHYRNLQLLQYDVVLVVCTYEDGVKLYGLNPVDDLNKLICFIN